MEKKIKFKFTEGKTRSFEPPDKWIVINNFEDKEESFNDFKKAFSRALVLETSLYHKSFHCFNNEKGTPTLREKYLKVFRYEVARSSNSENVSNTREVINYDTIQTSIESEFLEFFKGKFINREEVLDSKNNLRD